MFNLSKKRKSLKKDIKLSDKKIKNIKINTTDIYTIINSFVGGDSVTNGIVDMIKNSNVDELLIVPTMKIPDKLKDNDISNIYIGIWYVIEVYSIKNNKKTLLDTFITTKTIDPFYADNNTISRRFAMYNLTVSISESIKSFLLYKFDIYNLHIPITLIQKPVKELITNPKEEDVLDIMNALH